MACFVHLTQKTTSSDCFFTMSLYICMVYIYCELEDGSYDYLLVHAGIDCERSLTFFER